MVSAAGASLFMKKCPCFILAKFHMMRSLMRSRENLLLHLLVGGLLERLHANLAGSLRLRELAKCANVAVRRGLAERMSEAPLGFRDAASGPACDEELGHRCVALTPRIVQRRPVVYHPSDVLRRARLDQQPAEH